MRPKLIALLVAAACVRIGEYWQLAQARAKWLNRRQ